MPWRRSAQRAPLLTNLGHQRRLAPAWPLQAATGRVWVWGDAPADHTVVYYLWKFTPPHADKHDGRESM